MSERLLTYSQAGERIMGIGPHAVAELVRRKVLAAKVVIVRGDNKRPLKGVLESEVERYLRSLPEPDAKGKAPAAEKVQRKRFGGAALRAELAAAPVRCR